MIFRYFCILFFSVLTALPLDLKVSARSAILMNADTGAILYEKHAHIPAYPASITKIATAAFILDDKSPSLDQMVTVSKESLRYKSLNGEVEPHWLETDGTRMGLKKGEILSLEALLHGLMLVSGNDAANVLAESISGSVPQFVREMNLYVRELGCSNTQFCNPHGLHHPEHFTTAYDICLITKRALQIPKFREIVSRTSYWKAKTNKQGPQELKQKNPLIKPGKHFYSRAFGVKTGYTSAAMNTLVAAAEDGGRTLIAVVLGCEKRTDRYEDVIRLFEAAFQEQKEERRFFGREHLFSREVEGAKVPLRAVLDSDLVISYYPAEEPTCRAFVWWEPSHLPVRKGEKVGEVRICDEKGVLLQKKDLLAKEDLKGTFFFILKEAVLKLFR